WLSPAVAARAASSNSETRTMLFVGFMKRSIPLHDVPRGTRSGDDRRYRRWTDSPPFMYGAPSQNVTLCGATLDQARDWSRRPEESVNAAGAGSPPMRCGNCRARPCSDGWQPARTLTKTYILSPRRGI